MRKLVIAALVSVSLLSSTARAQALRPIGGNPAISPYLNLARPGINPAINYYGSVRPQLTYNAAINTLEQQVALSRVAITSAENQAVLVTGHPVQFLNYQRYFLNVGAQAPFQNLGATAGPGAGATTTSSAGGRALANINYGVSTPPTASSFRRY